MARTGTGAAARIASAAVAGLLFTSGHAVAGAFGVNEFGAAGTGLAAAGTTTSSAGLAALSFNPAALSLFDGARTSSTFSYIGPRATIDAPTGSTGDILNGGRMVPASQASFQVNDRLWLGLSIDSPFGLVSYIKPTNPASYYGTTTRVVDIDVTPIAAYRITDWLTLGAGLQINYIDAVLDGSFPGGVLGLHYMNLKGTDTALGYKLGALVTPMAGTEIGIGWRSAIRHSLKGTFETNLPVPVSMDATLGLDLPAQLNLGLRQQVTSALAISLGYQWTNWKSFDRFTATLANGGTLPLNFGYRDGWLVSAGADYQWNKATTLRAGVSYEQSPISKTIRDPRLPDSDRLMVSIGAGYKYSDHVTIDLAYAHVFMPGGDIDVTSPANPHFVGVPFTGTVTSSTDMASATVTYKW
jgi:long-chain fatty acid transport protein